MTDPGRALRLVQYRAHLGLDAIYLPLAAAVEAALLRVAEDRDGVPVLSPLAAVLAANAIRGEIARVEPAIVTEIGRAVVAAETAADPATPPALLPVLRAPSGALASLAANREVVIGQTAALLQLGLARGSAIADVARAVRHYFSPWFAARRDASGRLVRGDRLGAVRHWPGRAGMASAHARLVMLDATTAAHGRGMARLASRDGLGLHWNVSGKHLEIDRCDLNERQDVGYGPGNYPVAEFPPLPTHPRCRCYASTVELRAG